ncbi:MAG: hypothetical protein ACMV14_06040 [Prevotella sp.]
MKKIFYVSFMFIAIISMVGCNGKGKKTAQLNDKDSVVAKTEADTTVYGVCGEGTAMHSLELITDGGDTINYTIMDEGVDSASVLGGLLVGDRLAVIGHKVDGENYAKTVLNLTTLQGNWTSIDRNFEILEGGVVKSHLQAESNPWTEWKICNGKLLLNKDTFLIDNLGADSLYLESKDGIFAYKRQK